MENAVDITSCLACGHDTLTQVMDLHNQPLANSFIEDPAIPEYIFPLRLNLCPNCTHLQLSHAVNPEIIYKTYLYVSGTSQTYLTYMDWYATWALDQFNLHSNNISATSVMDIGCNDGSQLSAFVKSNSQIRTYGIDPAENLYPLSTGKGHNVICNFWSEPTVIELATRTSTVDIITSQNAFAHIADPLNYLRMVKTIMNDNSLMFISTSQADMVLNAEMDTIYHEHISYYNANSMQALAQRAGLILHDITKTPIHGTSYVFVLSKTGAPTANVQRVLAEESAVGLQTISTYEEYARKCSEAVAKLKETIKEYRADGYVIAGYGAAAKGNTLLNFGEIQLDFIIDDNPMKQGLFAPGSHAPVLSIDILKEVEDMNVAFVPLAWNFFDEIRANIRLVRNKDTDVFIKYAPGN
jgi:2-polyprenyl-3-methyl-5-hydroxy-6-metoxy-1,4-benzoquinol methylase